MVTAVIVPGQGEGGDSGMGSQYRPKGTGGDYSICVLDTRVGVWGVGCDVGQMLGRRITIKGETPSVGGSILCGFVSDG